MGSIGKLGIVFLACCCLQVAVGSAQFRFTDVRRPTPIRSRASGPPHTATPILPRTPPPVGLILQRPPSQANQELPFGGFGPMPSPSQMFVDPAEQQRFFAMRAGMMMPQSPAMFAPPAAQPGFAPASGGDADAGIDVSPVFPDATGGPSRFAEDYPLPASSASTPLEARLASLRAASAPPPAAYDMAPMYAPPIRFAEVQTEGEQPQPPQQHATAASEQKEQSQQQQQTNKKKGKVDVGFVAKLLRSLGSFLSGGAGASASAGDMAAQLVRELPEDARAAMMKAPRGPASLRMMASNNNNGPSPQQLMMMQEMQQQQQRQQMMMMQQQQQQQQGGPRFANMPMGPGPMFNGMMPQQQQQMPPMFNNGNGMPPGMMMMMQQQQQGPPPGMMMQQQQQMPPMFNNGGGGGGFRMMPQQMPQQQQMPPNAGMAFNRPTPIVGPRFLSNSMFANSAMFAQRAGAMMEQPIPIVVEAAAPPPPPSPEMQAYRSAGDMNVWAGTSMPLEAPEPDDAMREPPKFNPFGAPPPQPSVQAMYPSAMLQEQEATTLPDRLSEHPTEAVSDELRYSSRYDLHRFQQLLRVGDSDNTDKAEENFKRPPQEIVDKLYQMLKDFDELAKQQNIEYWMEGGTLLGAYRHKGFIPWDDDGDLGMWVRQEEKLKALEPKLKELGYGLVKYWYGYKIYDDKGPWVPKKTPRFKYPFVDIFLTEVNKATQKTFMPRSNLWSNCVYNVKDLTPTKLYDFGPLKLPGANNPKPYFDSCYNPSNDPAKDWNKVAFTGKDHAAGQDDISSKPIHLDKVGIKPSLPSKPLENRVTKKEQQQQKKGKEQQKPPQQTGGGGGGGDATPQLRQTAGTTTGGQQQQQGQGQPTLVISGTLNPVYM